MTSAAIHLALVDMTDAGEAATHWHTLLAPDERQRAASLPAALQGHWIGARAALRLLLGERLGRAPASLRFGRAAGGKPYLLEANGVFFNLAHAGALVACAFADQPDIGVDIEYYERRLPSPAHWGRFLDPLERAQVGACPRRFIRHWVHKEAVMKASGAGIRLAPRTIRLRDAGDGALCLDGVGAAGPRCWRLAGGEAKGGRHAWAVARRMPEPAPLQVTVATYAASVGGSGARLQRQYFSESE